MLRQYSVLELEKNRLAFYFLVLGTQQDDYADAILFFERVFVNPYIFALGNRVASRGITENCAYPVLSRYLVLQLVESGFANLSAALFYRCAASYDAPA